VISKNRDTPQDDHLPFVQPDVFDKRLLRFYYQECNQWMDLEKEVDSMKLVPWSQKSESPARLWPETTRLFDRVFDEFLNDRPLLSHLFQDRLGAAMPPVDILEKDGNLVLRAELPGMNEKDIELKLEGNVLTLKGERTLEKEEDRQNFHRMESFYGSFSRSFTLPDTVDPDKITADYRNGVLTIKVPQRPEAKPRAIQVKAS
jgi:HSP20 family protein